MIMGAMDAAEAALLAKLRRGEHVTAADHIPTIRTRDELHGFKRGLAEAGRLTPELLVEIYRHEKRLSA